MRRKFLMIELPEPCREDWAEMTPCARGRFCASCNKTVIDFSVMSDTEIVAQFRKDPSVCGAFSLSQLNRPIPFDEPRSWPGWYRRVGALLFLLAGMKAPAWSQSRRPRTEQLPPAARPDGKRPHPWLSVRIKDRSGLPVAGRTIEVRDALDGQRLGELRTDASGCAMLAFDTYRLPLLTLAVQEEGGEWTLLHDFYGAQEQELVLEYAYRNYDWNWRAHIRRRESRFPRHLDNMQFTGTGGPSFREVNIEEFIIEERERVIETAKAEGYQWPGMPFFLLPGRVIREVREAFRNVRLSATAKLQDGDRSSGE